METKPDDKTAAAFQIRKAVEAAKRDGGVVTLSSLIEQLHHTHIPQTCVFDELVRAAKERNVVIEIDRWPASR